MSPKPEKKASSSGMFSSATMRMVGSLEWRQCRRWRAHGPARRIAATRDRRLSAQLLANPVQVHAVGCLLFYQLVIEKNAELGNVALGRRVGGNDLEQPAGR